MLALILISRRQNDLAAPAKPTSCQKVVSPAASSGRLVSNKTLHIASLLHCLSCPASSDIRARPAPPDDGPRPSTAAPRRRAALRGARHNGNPRHIYCAHIRGFLPRPAPHAARTVHHTAPRLQHRRTLPVHAHAVWRHVPPTRGPPRLCPWLPTRQAVLDATLPNIYGLR